MDWNISLPPYFTIGKNFRMWSSKMRIFFKCIKLSHLPQDEENDCFHVDAFEDLIEMEKEQRHNLAMYHIQLALDPSLLHIVEGAPTAKEAQERLQNKFGKKKNDIIESTMSHEVKPTIVVEDNPTIRESHYENAPVDDEAIKEEKEDKHVDPFE